jgi:putative addiction module component (TIGR02574 family)
LCRVSGTGADQAFPVPLYNPRVTDIAKIRKLSVSERLQLVTEIWDSILDTPELLPVSDGLAEELKKRLEAHRASPEDSEPWDSVDRKVFAGD